MKIAFDEHVPDGMVRVFQSLVTERQMRRQIGANGRGHDGGYVIVRSRDYNPKPDDPDYLKSSDAPWINRFAQDAGKVIISGNVDMMQVPQEVLAIQQSGMISLYFESGWNSWDFFKKSSLLLWHWKLIIQAVQNAKEGDVYRIPASFSNPSALNLACRAGQLHLLTDTPHVATKEMRSIRKRMSRPRRGGVDDSQGRLSLPLDNAQMIISPAEDLEVPDSSIAPE